MVKRQFSLLVVDDNELNRDMLGRRLMRQGYRVSLAVDGRQALEMLREEAFDLVLLDIMMPEMNGFQVLEYLKADAALSRIPVIMTSALDELDGIERCIELGAEDYLTKPFNPVLLKARIIECLEKRRPRHTKE
jgi:CheY-like chemotaxis protein